MIGKSVVVLPGRIWLCNLLARSDQRPLFLCTFRCAAAVEQPRLTCAWVGLLRNAGAAKRRVVDHAALRVAFWLDDLVRCMPTRRQDHALAGLFVARQRFDLDADAQIVERFAHESGRLLDAAALSSSLHTTPLPASHG